MAMSVLGTEYYTEEPDPGDLIEIFRSVYQHWAIYVGNGYVVHLAPLCEVPGAGFGSVMSVTADIAYVEKEKLSVVVGTDEYQINNKHDARFSPLPKAKIVRRAEEMVGQVLRYSIITSNCEHFVTKIRYGEARSDQVRDAVAYTIGGVALAGLVGGIFWMASKNKQRNREDDY